MIRSRSRSFARSFHRKCAAFTRSTECSGERRRPPRARTTGSRSAPPVRPPTTQAGPQTATCPRFLVCLSLPSLSVANRPTDCRAQGRRSQLTNFSVRGHGETILNIRDSTDWGPPHTFGIASSMASPLINSSPICSAADPYRTLLRYERPNAHRVTGLQIGCAEPATPS